MDWKSTIGKVAPGIANMLGGPLAGMATNALCDMFGLQAGEEEQLKQAIKNMTPDQAIQMKEVENKLAIELKKVDVDIYKAEVADRDSARKEHKNNMTPAILTYLLTGCAGAIVYFVFNNKIPTTADSTLVGAIVGYVFAELKQATGFWLGSSFGSQEKTRNLNNTMNKN